MSFRPNGEMSIEIQEPRMMSGLDLRELTFQNVVDNILRPSGIKIGGFPEDLFLNLTEQEHQDMMCNICFLIANDCRLCNNAHVFCHSCIIAWSMTFGENAHKCPVCRCNQMEYNVNEDLQKSISSKQVRCLEEVCCFQSTLAEYLLHGHGKTAYSNAHVDFSCLRPRLIRTRIAADNGSQTGLSTSIRSQLLQSRTMIQQMMMLMRIEMQMRQQALVNFQQSRDSDAERVPQLDDALALNSQLSEISSVLATLIRSTSTRDRSSRRRPTHRDLAGPQRLRRVDGSGFARSSALRRFSNMSARQWREIDNVASDDSSTTDDDDDSCDEDDVIDLTNMTPVNDVVVDDFIWRQLTENTTADITVDSVRTSPVGMPAISSAPDVQSTSSIQSIPSIQPTPSISSVPSSMSIMSNISSYASSVSPSVSYEGRQMTPGYVLCMHNCHQTADEEQCPCQMCPALDGIAGEEDDQLVVSSHGPVHSDHALVGDGAPQPRPWPVHMLNASTHAESGAAVFDPRLSESRNACRTFSTSAVEPTSTGRHTLQPLVPRHALVPLPTPLPVITQHESTPQPAGDSSPLSLLPGTRRPPHLNYAGRLRRQLSEMTRLPSDVSVRPWPLPDAGLTTTGSRFTSPADVAGRPNSRSSARQLPPYLPPRQNSVATAVLQSSSTHRGNPTRLSRYNTSQTRLSRP